MEMLRRFDGYVKKMPTASALTIVTLCTSRRFVGRASSVWRIVIVDVMQGRTSPSTYGSAYINGWTGPEAERIWHECKSYSVTTAAGAATISTTSTRSSSVAKRDTPIVAINTVCCCPRERALSSFAGERREIPLRPLRDFLKAMASENVIVLDD